MNDPGSDPRIRLLRRAAVLQVKLLADGLRDALLVPLSLGAALIGLLRGGGEPDREFEGIIRLGRQSERWINLFGNRRPLGRGDSARSLDALLQRVEEAVVEQYRQARSPEEARAAIDEALKAAAPGGGSPGVAPARDSSV